MVRNSFPPTLEPGFVGVFDSGAGGLSVLRELVKELPNESFVYFGDSAYTPYGEKPAKWVLNRSRAIAGAMVERGAKAIVIACNTATAVAAPALREELASVPIIGVEPALKPATQKGASHRILVMATPMTLQLDKYHDLAHRWGEGHDVAEVECPGLAAAIEYHGPSSYSVRTLLEDLVGSYRGKVDGVVLGCTHYAFAAPLIREVLGDVALYDGAQGTARQVHRKLQEQDQLAAHQGAGSLVLLSSDERPEVIDGYQRLLRS